jgi:hypothetical protein
MRSTEKVVEATIVMRVGTNTSKKTSAARAAFGFCPSFRNQKWRSARGWADGADLDLLNTNASIIF